MSGVKRKRLVVTMEQKLKAIERLDKGESVNSISDELGVGVTTVKDWKRNKKSIQDYCTQIESEKILTSRCTLKKPTNKIVDDALWLWFTQERRKGTPISGPILKEKAMALHAKIENCGTFRASDSWLETSWYPFLSICGEKLSADPGASAEWIKTLEDVITKKATS
ncbi:jerky protein homolog-like [Nilaparvata lugens]|uniref:jerky protein homolog-like n=1 Tax=Nilaparvata lugens TaxID=108931 RepID=UPI00193EB155|nr:jerky protein homolog-like [Nilaparvata lugens]